MKRDVTKLRGTQFDVLIVGGGIYGVCAAWDAAMRGLSVALIEKDDFGAATSSNSLKIIHGGLRYLQHADFKRMRESITERRTLMRIAPHLVHPLKCIMPTYGHAIKGREVMAFALLVNDLIGYDRNSSIEPQKHMPRGRVISRDECKRIIPGVDDGGLTGGAVWYDCQVHNSERLLLAMLHSAIQSGAVAANYVEMTDFTVEGERVTGVTARDNLSGETFDIAASLVINNTGPWSKTLLSRLNGHTPEIEFELSLAMNLVVKRKLFDDYAVGISSKSEFKDEDAIISKGSRLFFITPWRDYSLIGTVHLPYSGAPSDFKVSEQHVEDFIAEVNQAYPPAKLSRNDVVFYYAGLLPSDGVNKQTGDVKLLKSYQLIDHKVNGSLDGLVTVVSVKYTTARDVAEKAIDLALTKLGRKQVDSVTGKTPVYGGDLDRLAGYIESEKARALDDLTPDVIEHLILNYGAGYPEVLKYCKQQPQLRNRIDEGSNVLQAEIVYAVREEMACHLADVVRRRTILGSAGCPEDEVLERCAQIMAQELNWNEEEIAREIEMTRQIYELKV